MRLLITILFFATSLFPINLFGEYSTEHDKLKEHNLSERLKFELHNYQKQLAGEKNDGFLFQRNRMGAGEWIKFYANMSECAEEHDALVCLEAYEKCKSSKYWEEMVKAAAKYEKEKEKFELKNPSARLFNYEGFIEINNTRIKAKSHIEFYSLLFEEELYNIMKSFHEGSVVCNLLKSRASSKIIIKELSEIVDIYVHPVLDEDDEQIGIILLTKQTAVNLGILKERQR
ncbi:hypothetical protein [Desulfocicer niacini]